MRIILVLTALVALCEGSRILMVLPLGSSSHKNIMTPLAEALGRRGHDVTLASLHASDNSTRSFTDLAATDAWETIRKVTGEFNVFKMREAGGGDDVNSQVMKKVLRHLPEYCDAFLKDAGVQSAWRQKPDLILLPAFMNECGLALVHKFKVPFMYVTTSGLTPWTADLVGNPENPAYVPNQYLSYGDHMTLWQRTVNTIVRIVSPYMRKQLVLNKLDRVAQRFLGDPTVSLAEVEKNVSLVLVNSHYSLGHPRPLSPNVIEVGAMHCRPARSLATTDPQLQHFMDSSPVPVVLFSLGSTIRSEQMPVRMREALVEAFRRLPYRVVWKWEGAAMQGLPSNVLTRSWLPQQDVLGHEKVAAFVTHGGLLSQQEAVYHGVPMVGIPLMSDQHLNVRQAVTLHLGVELKLESLTEDTLYDAIRKVVEDSSYKQQVQGRSMLLKDQETTPLNRAVYWSEHVLKHGGAQHLKSVSVDMPLHQYLLLDVALVLLMAVTILLILCYLMVKMMFRALVRAFKRVTVGMLRFVSDHVKTQ